MMCDKILEGQCKVQYLKNLVISVDNMKSGNERQKHGRECKKEKKMIINGEQICVFHPSRPAFALMDFTGRKTPPVPSDGCTKLAGLADEKRLQSSSSLNRHSFHSRVDRWQIPSIQSTLLHIQFTCIQILSNFYSSITQSFPSALLFPKSEIDIFLFIMRLIYISRTFLLQIY